MAELRVVYKYAFGDDTEIPIPWSDTARVVLVAAQRPHYATPSVWVEYPMGAQGQVVHNDLRLFKLVGTGHPVTDDTEWVGSVVCADGDLVWHVRATKL